jgi:hypothetical protein
MYLSFVISIQYSHPAKTIGIGYLYPTSAPRPCEHEREEREAPLLIQFDIYNGQTFDFQQLLKNLIFFVKI